MIEPLDSLAWVLQEMVLYEHDDLETSAVSMLAGDMLEDMHA